MAAEGWGEPPAAAATIVMGSGGRGENFLFPDQDNGFIVADYPDDEHGRFDAFFLELAERMCRDLNEIGIPYCNGYCMAVNPLWRKTLPQWIAQIGTWARKGSLVAVRLADIFFDFQPVWGEVGAGGRAAQRRHPAGPPQPLVPAPDVPGQPRAQRRPRHVRGLRHRTRQPRVPRPGQPEVHRHLAAGQRHPPAGAAARASRRPRRSAASQHLPIAACWCRASARSCRAPSVS